MLSCLCVRVSLKPTYCQWTWSIKPVHAAVVWDEYIGSPTYTRLWYDQPDKFVPSSAWDAVQNRLTLVPDEVGIRIRQRGCNVRDTTGL